MQSAFQPTAPLNNFPTSLCTTDRCHLPASSLLKDAPLTASIPYRAAAPLEAAAEASGDERILRIRLQGHRFLACLESGPLGELWKVCTDDGRIRLARLLRGARKEIEDRALIRLAAVVYPALPPLEIVRSRSGQVVLLTDPYDGTFADWYAECRGRGLPGIPRPELLGALATAARDLDELYRDYRLQHLALSPTSLWIKDGRVQIGGFGLTQLLGVPAGHSPAALNPRYSALELFDGLLSVHCDQYSLALIYVELLTGQHPLRTLGTTRLASGRRAGRPSLDGLSAGDRAVLSRALDRDPAGRFADGPEFLRALDAVRDGSPAPDHLPPLLAAGAGKPAFATVGDFVAELVRLAAGPLVAASYGSLRYCLEPGQGLRHQYRTGLYPGAAQLKLEAFRQEWDAETALRPDGAYVLTVRTRPTFWQRLTGREVGLELEVRLTPPTRRAGQSQVAVVIRPFGCGRKQAAQLLRETGPVLLEGLRRHLGAEADQRGQERLPLEQPLLVTPVIGGELARAPLECHGKDISRSGIGFFLARPLAASRVYVSHPSAARLHDTAALAEVVRGQQAPDGWYEIGARFSQE